MRYVVTENGWESGQKNEEKRRIERVEESREKKDEKDESETQMIIISTPQETTDKKHLVYSTWWVDGWIV